MERISETCQEIAPEELKTGDIAVMELVDGRKDFAVCIGAYKEIFLFAHCVNTADSSFPGGCARICFMASQTDSYYRGSGPASFTSFYQSPVGFWGNPDNAGSTGENPDQRILIDISENPRRNDVIYRYADALVHELASGNYDSFLSDLACKELIKYGYEYTDENAYRQYLHKIYETIHDKNYLYVAFVNGMITTMPPYTDWITAVLPKTLPMITAALTLYISPYFMTKKMALLCSLITPEQSGIITASTDYRLFHDEYKYPGKFITYKEFVID